MKNTKLLFLVSLGVVITGGALYYGFSGKSSDSKTKVQVASKDPHHTLDLKNRKYYQLVEKKRNLQLSSPTIYFSFDILFKAYRQGFIDLLGQITDSTPRASHLVALEQSFNKFDEYFRKSNFSAYYVQFPLFEDFNIFKEKFDPYFNYYVNFIPDINTKESDSLKLRYQDLNNRFQAYTISYLKAAYDTIKAEFEATPALRNNLDIFNQAFAELIKVPSWLYPNDLVCANQKTFSAMEECEIALTNTFLLGTITAILEPYIYQNHKTSFLSRGISKDPEKTARDEFFINIARQFNKYQLFLDNIPDFNSQYINSLILK